jgi:hypothetical protein
MKGVIAGLRLKGGFTCAAYPAAHKQAGRCWDKSVPALKNVWRAACLPAI